MAYEYSSWDALLYKSSSGGYRIKASAARKGATMKAAQAALGALPSKYVGKVSGYNPNLVRTDLGLAKDLGMNVKKEEARLDTLAKEKNANALTNMQATPVQYADNAMISNAADYKAPAAPAPATGYSVQALYPEATPQAFNASQQGKDTFTQWYESLNPSQQAYYQKRMGEMVAAEGLGGQADSLSRIGRLQTEIQNMVKDPANWALDGVAGGVQAVSDAVPQGFDDFLQNNPLGQALAPVLAVGGGWSSQSGAHFGMGDPNVKPQMTEAQANNIIDKATVDNPSVTPDWHNGTQQITPQYPFSPTSDVIGPERPGDVQLADTKAPIYPTPTGEAIPMNTGTTTSGSGTGAGSSGTGGTTAAPTGDTAAPAAAAGAGAAGVASGNWWENPAALAALGAVVGGGTSVLAANKQAEAAAAAAQAQTDASNAALAEMKRQFDTQQGNIAPWMEAGKTALTDLQNFDTNYTPFTFTNDDPSYSFRLSEGLKALNNGYAAKGMLQSGNAMKGITDYGQQAASQEYQNAFNRYQTRRGENLNRIQSLAGVGQSAVQQANNASSNYANNATNAMMGGAQAKAQGIQGGADAWSSGLMGVGNSIIGGLNNYYQQQQNQQMMGLMNSFLRK